jgi:ribonuclease J
MNVMLELADGSHKDLTLKEGDTVIYSADIYPGRSRQMAVALDQFMSMGITVVYGIRHGIHVSSHASREEQKLMLSIANPEFFVPALGEGRHIMHHAQLAMEWGLPPSSVFPLKNGEVLELYNGNATVIGAIESSPVYFNKDQGDRVTTYSVNERRSLSLEGIVTIGLVVDHKGRLVSGPSVEVSASGFMQSQEWLVAREDLLQAIKDSLDKYQPSQQGQDAAAEYELAALRASVREVAVKALRTKLQAKPTVQVVVHELAAI